MTPRRPRHVAIVPHTHWDREWYEPYQSFRLRLVRMLDALIPLLESDPSYARFLLDGQMAVVDDYLEVRPENEERIRALAAAGRLSMGPWYILMDEFLVSGETIVRDLQSGMLRGAAFGGAMEVGYLPDMFGHIAQMPQILRLAGFEHAVVWRGVPSVVDRSAFVWEAPDGSSVRAEYLPTGYGNGASIPDDAKALVRRVADHEKEIGDFLIDGMLFMNGTDHQEPQPWLGRVVAEANDIQDDYVLEVTTLPDYLAGAPTEGLRTWKGELRSGARANVLMGVASNRVDVKQAAARAERALERRAEPLCALYMAAERWPQRLLDLAWREMVRNAAHDSSCACSVDEVVDAVLVRYAEAYRIADGLGRPGARGAVAVAGRGGPHRRQRLGPGPQRDGGVRRDRGGGPRGWPGAARGARRLRHPPGSGAADPRRRHGAHHPRHAAQRQPDRHPHLDPGRPRRGGRRRGSTSPSPSGARSASTSPSRRSSRTSTPGSGPGPTPSCASGSTSPRCAGSWPGWPRCPGSATGRSSPSRSDTRSPSRSARRGARGHGQRARHRGRRPPRRDLRHRRRGRVRRLVDGGDHGDSYNYSPPAGDRIVDTPDSVTVTVAERGPVRAVITVVARYTWPDHVDGVTRARTGEVTVDVTTDIEVRADERIVRVTTRFVNPASDHRLRVHLPLPEPAEGSEAECAFAVVHRGLDAEGRPDEFGLPTFPSRRFVSAGGLTVAHEGLLEYELVDIEGEQSGAPGHDDGTHAAALDGDAVSPRHGLPPPAGGAPHARRGLAAAGGAPSRRAMRCASGATTPTPWWTTPSCPSRSSTPPGADGARPRGARSRWRGPRCPPCAARPACSRCGCSTRPTGPTRSAVGARSGWLVDLRGRTVEPVDGSFVLRPFGIATFRSRRADRAPAMRRSPFSRSSSRSWSTSASRSQRPPSRRSSATGSVPGRCSTHSWIRPRSFTRRGPQHPELRTRRRLGPRAPALRAVGTARQASARGTRR